MENSRFEAAVRPEDGNAVIDLHGDINSNADHNLTAAYEAATALEARTIVLNFSQADYINSTGIALIVGLLARARQQKIEVRAWGLTEHYREIFEITRVADFMKIFNDEPSALAIKGATTR